MVLFTVVKTSSRDLWVLQSFHYNCDSGVCLGRSLFKKGLCLPHHHNINGSHLWPFSQTFCRAVTVKESGVGRKDTKRRASMRARAKARAASSLYSQVESLTWEKRARRLRLTHLPIILYQWIEPFVYPVSKIFKAGALQIWLSTSEYDWKGPLLWRQKFLKMGQSSFAYSSQAPWVHFPAPQVSKS